MSADGSMVVGPIHGGPAVRWTAARGLWPGCGTSTAATRRSVRHSLLVAVRREHVQMTSADNLLHHVPLHVSQPHIAAGVAIGQFLVVQAKQMEDGRMPVVDVHLSLHSFVTIIVGGPVGEAAL